MLAVIPARKGSKGLKDKNISLLNNKPLILYTLMAAIQSQLFDRIVVTTDDSRIIKLIENLNYYNVTIIRRPKYLATDTVTLNPVIIHAVKWIEKYYGKVNTIVTLQPTSPLRNCNHIFRAFIKYRMLGADSLVSVTKEEHNIYRSNKSGYDRPIVYHKVNRQQIEPYYIGNGAISICKRDLLMKHNTRIGDRLVLYKMSKRDSIDIHTEEDLELCQWYMNRKK